MRVFFFLSQTQKNIHANTHIHTHKHTYKHTHTVLALKVNTTLQQLYLGNNKLVPLDCLQLHSLLNFNRSLKLLDLRNNNCQVPFFLLLSLSLSLPFFLSLSFFLLLFPPFFFINYFFEVYFFIFIFTLNYFFDFIYE